MSSSASNNQLSVTRLASPSASLSLVLLLLWAQFWVQACWAQTNNLTSINLVGEENDLIKIGSTTASHLVVSLTITPQVGNKYVAANTPLNVTAKVSGGLNESQLEFEWATKDGAIKTQPHSTEINHVFTKSDEDNFISVLVSEPVTNATGWARLDVLVRSLVVVMEPSGKLFLERGELLNISLRYSGSPPFTYCYKFCTPYDFLPCNYCLLSHETTHTVIPIVHYLHNVGNYTLMFWIQNVMNQDQRYYAIKINDSVRKSNLPIVPIVSTILSVMIIISGVALHLKFRDTPYTTETANFDFFNDNDDEDWEQEFSFIQRVKYLFCGITDQDEEGDETRYLLRKNSPASSSSSGHGTNTTTTTTTLTAIYSDHH